MAEIKIQASWEVFDMCNTCGTGAKEPCYNLKWSTSKNLIINNTVHHGRKMLTNVD